MINSSLLTINMYPVIKGFRSNLQSFYSYFGKSVYFMPLSPPCKIQGYPKRMRLQIFISFFCIYVYNCTCKLCFFLSQVIQNIMLKVETPSSNLILKIKNSRSLLQSHLLWVTLNAPAHGDQQGLLGKLIECTVVELT